MYKLLTILVAPAADTQTEAAAADDAHDYQGKNPDGQAKDMVLEQIK